MILIFCEGRRNANFVESVLEYYKIARFIGRGDEKFSSAIGKIKDYVKGFVGYIRSVYEKRPEEYIYVFEVHDFSRIQKERENLKEIFEDLKEKYTIIFVVDKEYKDVVETFGLAEQSIVFEERIEDFIKNIVNKIIEDVDKESINEVRRVVFPLCKKFLDNKIDEEKFEIQTYHLIFSGGECDKKMFSIMFKLLDQKKVEIHEINNLIEIIENN